MPLAAGMALLSLVWGTQFVAIKLGQSDAPPLLTVAMRYAVLLVAAQAACLASPSTTESHRALRGQRLAFGVAQAFGMMPLYRAQGLVGVALLVASAGLDAVTKVLAKRLASAAVPVPVMLRDMALAVTPVALAASFLVEGDRWRVPGPAASGTALYLGLVGSAFASGLYLRLLARHSVNALAYLQFLTACVAALTGVLMGESLGASTWAGVAVILAGLVLRARATR